MHIKKGGKAVGFGMAAGEDETVSFGWPIVLSEPLGIAQGGTGASTAATARSKIGAFATTGGTITGNMTVSTSLYPSIYLKPTYNSTTNMTVFEGSYVGASSFASWEDSSGTNRRMIEVRNAAYAPSMDNAVVLRNVIDGTYYAHRIFHAGMSTPVPLANGGTGASSAAGARVNLGITSATISDTSTFIGTLYFYIGNVLVQMGVTDTISAPSKGTVDTVITFPKAYTVVPKVMVSDYYNNSSYSYILETKSVASAVTTTALTIRSANNTSGARSIRASWLAIGI